jgi:hypothetical protein
MQSERSIKTMKVGATTLFRVKSGKKEQVIMLPQKASPGKPVAASPSSLLYFSHSFFKKIVV